MADEKQRARAAAEAEKAEQKRWDDWVELQESLGFTVHGDGFHNARVVELGDGPDHEVSAGG